MDFLEYENSTAILDQSGVQQLGFFVSQCSVEVYKFMEIKNITLSATPKSSRELSYQAYDQNLFSGDYSSTLSDANNKQNYILSRTNCSLTLKELDNKGYPITIVSISNDKNNFQSLLWDSSHSFKRMKNNKRSNADISSIFLARNLALNGVKFFCFSNDSDQINQFRIEGYKYLRPSDFLTWMVKDNYITRQKGVWCYEKAKKHNLRWMEKNRKFSDILNK